MKTPPHFSCRLHPTNPLSSSCVVCAVVEQQNANPTVIPKSRPRIMGMTFGAGVRRYQHQIDYQAESGPRLCSFGNHCPPAPTACYITYSSYFYGKQTSIRTHIETVCKYHAQTFANRHGIALPELLTMAVSTTHADPHTAKELYD